VRDQLLAALDRLLRDGKSVWAGAVLRLADPDPYRDAVRDGVLAGNGAALAELTLRSELADQSSGFVAVLGENTILTPVRRRAVLGGAVLRRPGDLGLLMALSYTYPTGQTGGADERKRWLQAAVAAAPGNPAAHNALGVAHRDLGDSDRALAEYREAMRLAPRFGFPHINLANVLRENGDLAGAEEAAQTAIQLLPAYSGGVTALGLVQRDRGDLAAAEESFRKAARLVPSDPWPPANLAVVLRMKADQDGALAANEEAIRLDPNSALFRSDQASTLRMAGDFEGAAKAYQEALLLDANHAGARSGLADLEQMIEILPGLPDLLAGRAEPKTPHQAIWSAYLCIQPSQKRYAAGARLFEWAVAANPGFATWHRYEFVCAAALAVRGEGADAPTDPAARAALRAKVLAWLRAALAEHRTQAASSASATRKAAVGGLSNWLRDTDLSALRPGSGQIGMPADERAVWNGFWAEVEAVLAEARQPPPTSEAVPSPRVVVPAPPIDYLARGSALRDRGDQDGAEEAFRTAVRNAPTNPWAHAGLAETLRLKRDMAGAAALFAEAARLDPKSVYFRARHGLTVYDTGDFDAAEKVFRDTLRLDPNEATSRYRLDDMKQMRLYLPGLPDVLAGRVEPKAPIEAWWCAFIGIQHFQRRYADAVRLYDRAIAVEPGFAAWHGYEFAVAAALAARGDGVDAPADPDARAALRAKALAWLRLDLVRHRRLADSSLVATRQATAGGLTHWLRDPDLSALRPGLARSGMPAGERAQWDALWADVKATIAMARQSPPPSEGVAPPRVIDALPPAYVNSWLEFGWTLFNRPDVAGAETAFRKAVQYDPASAWAQVSLAAVLRLKGDLKGAVAASSAAVRLEPNSAQLRADLGVTLEAAGDFDGAESAYREALRLDPKHAGARDRLLGIEQIRAFLPGLPDILAGRVEPKSAHQAIWSAFVCIHTSQKRYAAGVRLYERAVAADPGFAPWHRDEFASAAARAGRGEGADAPPDPAARADLRAKALALLRADLDHYRKRVASPDGAARRAAADRMSYWPRDPGLSVLWPGLGQIDLPADERAAWSALWAEVKSLIAEARQPVPPSEAVPPPRVVE
jgi:tetratricopeptide (TPR) repeat protein